jgi:hypothetical protein
MTDANSGGASAPRRIRIAHDHAGTVTANALKAALAVFGHDASCARFTELRPDTDPANDIVVVVQPGPIQQSFVLELAEWAVGAGRGRRAISVGPHRVSRAFGVANDEFHAPGLTWVRPTNIRDLVRLLASPEDIPACERAAAAGSLAWLCDHTTDELTKRRVDAVGGRALPAAAPQPPAEAENPAPVIR